MLSSRPVSAEINKSSWHPAGCWAWRRPTAMVAVDFEHFGVVVGVDLVIGKADLFSFTGSIHQELAVEVKRAGAHACGIHFVQAVGLLLGDNFTDIL